MNLPPTRLDTNWRAITAELDAPRPRRLERVLHALGVPATATRVVAATPALRRAWYLSIGITVLAGLGVARPDDRESLFALLLLAPAVPVLGVALAFGPAADPMHEAQLATPTRGLRLVAIRAVTVVGVSILAITPLAAMSPAARPVAVVWLLPALALTSASLAAMTVTTPRRATSIVATAWFVTLTAVRAIGGLAAFGLFGQLSALIVAVAGGVVLVLRRDCLDRLGVVR